MNSPPLSPSRSLPLPRGAVSGGGQWVLSSPSSPASSKPTTLSLRPASHAPNSLSFGPPFPASPKNGPPPSERKGERRFLEPPRFRVCFGPHNNNAGASIIQLTRLTLLLPFPTVFPPLRRPVRHHESPGKRGPSRRHGPLEDCSCLPCVSPRDFRNAGIPLAC